MENLTVLEKKVLAQALIDYRDGIDNSDLANDQPQEYEELINILDSIENKIGE